MKTCIGFGDKTGKCKNPAGTKWSPYWCEECNAARLKHLDKQFRQIDAHFREISTNVDSTHTHYGREEGNE